MASLVKLTAPNGATVKVAERQVDALLSRGFTKAESHSSPAKKTAPAKRASSAKSNN